MSTMKKGRGSLEKTESRDAWIMMTPALIVLAWRFIRYFVHSG